MRPKYVLRKFNPSTFPIEVLYSSGRFLQTKDKFLIMLITVATVMLQLWSLCLRGIFYPGIFMCFAGILLITVLRSL